MKAVLGLLVCVVCGFGQRSGLPRERALGEELAAEVERQSTVVSDPVIAEYIDRVAQGLVARCPTEMPIDVRVIVSDQMNAFALPGGFLFVNTALIRTADSEAELAGVLAHLIAHVQPGGLAGSSRPGQFHNYGSVPLIFMGGWSGHAYRSEAGSTAIPVGLLDAYRAAVFEADQRGVQCLAAASYDPEAFIQNLKRLQTSEARSGETSRRFLTHPPAAERVEKVQHAIDRLSPRSEYLVNTSQFNEVKHRVEFLYPPQPRRAASPPSLRN
jgi:predicted Zn-dependent protease